MHKFLLLLACMACSLSNRAQAPDTTIEQRLSMALSQLDYDSLVTGIHIDRVPQYLPVALMDGGAYADSMEMTWKELAMLYGMLAYCQVDSIHFPLMDSAYTEAWQGLEDIDTTVIGGLWMRYDRFKPWAIDSNLVTFDSIYFYVVPGPVSPFEQRDVFAFSVSDPVRYGLTHVVHLDTAWLFTNQPGGPGESVPRS
ncbi:MAG: hypothetical protein J5I41_06715 [Saprospiraceae bacterium]|nr:hypothetical protein [Saprospiraceae bacterium]